MNFSDLWANIERRRDRLIRKFGSEEAAMHYLATDPILDNWYRQADQKAKELQPQSSPAFANSNYITFLAPRADLLPLGTVISHGTT